MLLTLKEEHQLHLQFLKNQTMQVVQDFCQLATNHVEKGPNAKTYSSAAQKLNVSSDDIRYAAEALVFLSLEAARFQVSEEDLGVTFIALGFSPEQRDILGSWVKSQSSSLALGTLRPYVPHYSSLAWRLEASLASRSLLTHQGNCSITLMLNLSDGKKKIVLQSTPSMLRHLTSMLEVALAEANSRHARHALRTIK